MFEEGAQFFRNDVSIQVGPVPLRESWGVSVHRPGVMEDANAYFRGTPSEQKRRAEKFIKAMIEILGVEMQDKPELHIAADTPTEREELKQVVAAEREELQRLRYAEGEGWPIPEFLQNMGLGPVIGERQFVLLSQVTLSALQAENISAQAKHGLHQTNLSPNLADCSKLANLVEEVGEVAKLYTYDNHPKLDGVWRTDDEMQQAMEVWYLKLVRELLQVANLAAAWAQCADKQRAERAANNLEGDNAD
jgi:hypothetical protein